MGLFGNIFGGINLATKQVEVSKLINDTMLATNRWEASGEKASGQEILDAASAIRNNFERIIDLYNDLVKAHGNKNLSVKITALPPPFPREINILVAIMGILDFAEAIISKNPSFQYGLVSPEARDKVARLVRGF